MLRVRVLGDLGSSRFCRAEWSPASRRAWPPRRRSSSGSPRTSRPMPCAHRWALGRHRSPRHFIAERLRVAEQTADGLHHGVKPACRTSQSPRVCGSGLRNRTRGSSASSPRNRPGHPAAPPLRANCATGSPGGASRELRSPEAVAPRSRHGPGYRGVEPVLCADTNAPSTSEPKQKCSNDFGRLTQGNDQGSLAAVRPDYRTNRNRCLNGGPERPARRHLETRRIVSAPAVIADRPEFRFDMNSGARRAPTVQPEGACRSPHLYRRASTRRWCFRGGASTWPTGRVASGVDDFRN